MCIRDSTGGNAVFTQDGGRSITTSLSEEGYYDVKLTKAVDSILPNPDQPRTLFSQPELEELADSIQSMGILQPLTVRRREGGWELVYDFYVYLSAGLCGSSHSH